MFLTRGKGGGWSNFIFVWQSWEGGRPCFGQKHIWIAPYARLLLSKAWFLLLLCSSWESRFVFVCLQWYPIDFSLCRIVALFTTLEPKYTNFKTFVVHCFVSISRGQQILMIWTLGPDSPRGPSNLPSPILLPNNDSYRQNSALHFFTFDRIGLVFKLVYLGSTVEKKWHFSA